KRQRIGTVNPNCFTQTAVKGFKNHHAFADVDARGRADAADQTRSEIADDVAVQIPHDQDVELRWPRHQLHAAVIDDQLLRLQSRKILGDRAEGFEEQPVGELEDIRLMYANDRLASMIARPFKSETEEALARGLGDDLDALHDAGDDFVFDGRVQILREFADDEHINALEARRQPLEVLERPDGGEQAQRLAKLDVVGAVRTARRQETLGLEGQAVAADGLQHRLGQGGQALLDGGEPCEMVIPGDIDASRGEDSLHRRHLVVTDAAALNQCYG